MNRSGKILLLAVMAAAVLVSCALWGDVLRDAGELKKLTAALTESRAAWEATAEAKEALQAELKTAEDELKEAKLTLRESTERAETLEKEIKVLEEEIAALKGEKP